MSSLMKDHLVSAWEEVTEPVSEVRVCARAYLGQTRPPDESITSVRCIVVRGESVLVCRNRDQRYHVMRGGPRQKGETFDQTQRRELLEESGWSVGAMTKLLGFIHFQHLLPNCRWNRQAASS